MADLTGHGTTLERSSDGTSMGSFASIGVLYSDITPPAISADFIDVTKYSSADFFAEKIKGKKDPGQMSAVVQFDPGEATFATILADLNSETIQYYRLTFPDDGSTPWGFPGFIAGVEAEAPLEGRMAATVTWELSGKPDFFA